MHGGIFSSDLASGHQMPIATVHSPSPSYDNEKCLQALPSAGIAKCRVRLTHSELAALSSFVFLEQRISTATPRHTSVPQESLKHAMPDYLVRGTDLFSLRLSSEKMTRANTKSYLTFIRSAKNIFFGVMQNFSDQFRCAGR